MHVFVPSSVGRDLVGPRPLFVASWSAPSSLGKMPPGMTRPARSNASSAGGGSKSGAPGGRGKRIGTNESDINAMVSSGLDFSGTTEMMLDTTWTFKNKIVVERQPDSRKCLTCFIRDDMMCPLGTALEGVRRYVAWGQTHTDGTSLTPRCGFCFNHFNSVVRYSRVPPVKLEEYEAQLGASEKLLELHVARITMLIHDCIKRGRMDFRVNWEGIEKKALRVVQRKSMIKKKNRV